MLDTPPEEDLGQGFENWARYIEQRSPIWNDVEGIGRIGAWALDVTTGSVSWTRGVYEIYGLAADSVREKETALSYYEAEDQTRLIAAIESAIQDQRPYDLTCRLRRKDSERRVVRTSGKPVTVDGKVVRLAGVIQDITDQFRLEEQLRDSEHNFHEIINSVDAVFWVRSHDLNQLLYVSDSYETRYDNSIAEAHRNPASFLDGIHPDDRPAVEAADAEYRRSYHMDMEYRVWKRDGSLAWVNVRSYPVRDDHGDVVRHVGIAIDITKRKQYEELLEQQHSLQHLVTSISTDFIRAPVGSVETEILQALERLSEHLAVDRAYVFQLNPRQHTMSNTHEWCREGISSHMRRLQEIPVISHEWWMSQILENNYVLVPRVEDLPESAITEREEFEREGIRSLLEVPISSEGGILGFLGFDSVSDYRVWADWEIELLRVVANALASAIERTDREQAIIDARDASEIATKAKTEFLARMSHELRTPLNAVVGFSDLLLTTPLSEVQKTYLSSVLVSASSLRSIINDLLDFSVMEAGRLKIEKQAVSISEIMGQSIAQVRIDAEIKGLELAQYMDPDVPDTIETDPHRLRQILGNLLVNAIKFTDSGHVHVRTSIMSEDSMLRITVEDTGVGIADSNLELVFASFTQADESTTRVHGGRGLGLAIARGLAEGLGGCLQAASTPGVGSTFSVFLPCAMAQKRPGTPRHPTDTTPSEDRSCTISGSVNILLAEDNALNLLLARELIKTVVPEAKVQTAQNGREAVDACRNAPPDIVLMDIQMPEMDGHEATRQIRRMSPTREPYIVALTAGASDEERRLSLEAGMNDHIAKPVTRESLYQALFKAVEQCQTGGDSTMTEQAITETLRKRGHSPETIEEVISLLRERVPELTSFISDALASHDVDVLQREAHSAKGILRTLMLEEIGDTAHELELAARARSQSDIDDAGSKLLDQLARLEAGLS